MLVTRTLKAAKISPYLCPPNAHLDPNFVRDHIVAVLIEQGYEAREAKLAATRIEEKYRNATKR